MSDDIRRVRIEEVDWRSLLSWVRIFDSFRLAIRPSRLLLALLMVMLLYFGGRRLDAMWTSRASEGRGIFATALEREVNAFEQLTMAATSLRFGFSDLLGRGSPGEFTVVDALNVMVVQVPSWMFREHTVFCLI